MKEEISEITIKVVVDKEEKVVTFLRPEKIKEILSDKVGLFSELIRDLVNS